MNTKNKEKDVEEQTAVVAAEQTAGTALEVIDYGDDAGLGMEDIGSDEIKIPLLRVLQANSPQCDESDGKHIIGAKPGMILNTSTGEIYDGKVGLVMIPCEREHKYIEYRPRMVNGGGFIGAREPDDALIRDLIAKQGKFGKLSNGVTDRDGQGNALNGTEIQQTFSLYAILVAANGTEFRALVPFASTQIPIYQGFVGRMDGIKYEGPNGKVRPPAWAHRWRLITTPQSNKKGKFFGWNISLEVKKADGSDDEPIKSRQKLTARLYLEGRAFYDLIKAGKAQADHAADAVTGVEKDDEIPM